MANNNNTIIGTTITAEYVGGNVNSVTNISLPKIEPAGIGFGFFDPDKNFTGRQVELDYLKKVTANQPDKTTENPVIVVSGLGGIGKTQLVRKFIYENKSSYKNVVWINAQEHGMINTDFEKLADVLNILTHVNGKKIDCNSIIEKVLNKLCASPTLIVFDNADKTENIQFVVTMGTLCIVPQIVITSRIQEWSDFICLIKLDVFSSEDAFKYVSTALHPREDDAVNEEKVSRGDKEDPREDDAVNEEKDSREDKEELMEILQRFPLALKQATAHIRYMRIGGKFSIANYIKIYTSSQKHQKDFLGKECKNDFFHKYEETTFTTWKVTIDAINKCEGTGELALTILRIISFFDPVHIRRDIFFNLNVSSDNETTVKNVTLAIRLLVNYSMLDSKDQQSVLSIHRLVQEVIKIYLKSVKDMTKATLWNSLHLLSKMKESENFEQCHEHCISVFNSALKFDGLIREFKSFPAMIIQSLIEFNKFFRAEYFGSKIIQPLETCLGDGHLDTLITKSAVAASYRCLGKHSDAVRMYQAVLDKQKVILKEDHSDILTTKSNIAFSLDEIGDHSVAEKMYKEVLEAVKTIYGEDHPKTLSTKSNIATIYVAQGKHSEAIGMYKDVFDRISLLLPDNDPLLLTTKSNMAYSYNAQGKYSDALRIDQEVFEKQKTILGEDHPDTLTRQFNIACLHGEIGKHSEALQLYEKVFEKRKTILGEDHPDTLRTKKSIASSYRAQRNYSKALQWNLEVFEKLMIILGGDHPKTLDSKFMIAVLNNDLEEYSVALQMFKEVFKKQVVILGDDHPDTLLTKSNIAFTHHKIGNHSKSILTYQEVLEKQMVRDKDHPDTLTTKSNMASTYRALGEHSEALKMYQDVLEKFKTSIGKDHPKYIATEFNIAITLSTLGKHSEALQMFEQQNAKLGENHPYTLKLKSNIASSHYKMGNYSMAIQVFQEVLEKERMSLGKDHPDTLYTKSNIASAYQSLQKHSEALKMYQEVLGKQKTDLGDDHPDTLLTKSNITISHNALRKHAQMLQNRVGLAVLFAGLIAALVFQFFFKSD